PAAHAGERLEAFADGLGGPEQIGNRPDQRHVLGEMEPEVFVMRLLEGCTQERDHGGSRDDGSDLANAVPVDAETPAHPGNVDAEGGEGLEEPLHDEAGGESVRDAPHAVAAALGTLR